MNFAVRDLMLNVLPENGLAAEDLRLCKPQTGPPPKPDPGPYPRPEPEPQPVTATGQQGFDEGPALPPLVVLREQLQQALQAQR